MSVYFFGGIGVDINKVKLSVVSSIAGNMDICILNDIAGISKLKKENVFVFYDTPFNLLKSFLLDSEDVDTIVKKIEQLCVELNKIKDLKAHDSTLRLINVNDFYENVDVFVELLSPNIYNKSEGEIDEVVNSILKESSDVVKLASDIDEISLALSANRNICKLQESLRINEELSKNFEDSENQKKLLLSKIVSLEGHLSKQLEDFNNKLQESLRINKELSKNFEDSENQKNLLSTKINYIEGQINMIKDFVVFDRGN